MPLLRLIYIGILFLAVIFFVQAQQFRGAISPRDIGPAAFPQGIAGLIVVLGTIGLIAGWRTTPKVPWSDVALPLAVGAVASVAMWLATLFGFFTVLPFALFVGLWASGSRQWVAVTAFSLLVPLFAWLIFVRLLGLPLMTI
ncbi:hypothetical protein E0K89_001040 [Aquicoccus sp. SCR17]|nr:hypothetical protein [Carideicomes alvinocaridis]